MNGRTNSTKDGDTIINGALIPLEPITNFDLVAQDKEILLRWEDPVDKTATPGGELVAEWDRTIIVRKIGSQPTSSTDGTIATTETTRNQYQATDFHDQGLINNTEYHYAAYAYSKYNVFSDGVFNQGTPDPATPVFYKYTDQGFPGNQRHDIGSSSGTNHALITGGTLTYENGQSWSDYSGADAYDSELTFQSWVADLSTGYGDSTCGAFCNNKHIIMVSGEIPYAIDDSALTRQKLSNVSATTRYKFGASLSFNNNGMFAGGTEYGSPYSVESDISIYYNSTLTMQTLESLSEARSNMLAAANENYLIYAGGMDGADWQDLNYSTTDAYNSNFTKIQIAELSTERKAGYNDSQDGGNGGGCNVGNYLIFAGGNESVVTEAYDESLTRSTIASLIPESGGATNVDCTLAEPCGENTLICMTTPNGGSTNGYNWYDAALTLHRITGVPNMANYGFNTSAIVGDYVLFPSVYNYLEEDDAYGNAVAVFHCV